MSDERDVTKVGRLQGRRIEGTRRMESLSDGVFAIILTLLIFEIAVPVVANPHEELAQALGDLLPKFVSFSVSFFTVAIFWVNHHHFLHRVTHSDWKLLWCNNLLLFWLAVVPFSTALIGDYPREPVAVSLYAANLGLAGLAFAIMLRYVFFGGKLADPSMTPAALRREMRRGWMGVGAYLSAAAVAWISVPAAIVLLIVIPFAYVVPGLVRDDAD